MRKLVDPHVAKSFACSGTRAGPGSSTRARASPCSRASPNARADSDANTCAGCRARIGVDESSFG